MGRRGRKPKPSALDKLDGGASHRKRNRKEPKPPPSEQACPDWLRSDPVARVIWESEAPTIIRMGCLTKADRLLFSALCERAALYHRASQRLRRAPKKGEDVLLTSTKANGKQPRPEIGIAKGALEGLRQLAALFGMSPADRKGLEVDLGAGAARGGSDAAGGSPKKPKAGAAIEIDEFLRRREARRSS
jgi:phage terminase small subunit